MNNKNNDDFICEEKTFTKGRISFGKSSIKKKTEEVSTGDRKDGREYIYCGSGAVTIYSKLGKTGKRELIYRGPEEFFHES